jgi:hypothetical protein
VRVRNVIAVCSAFFGALAQASATELNPGAPVIRKASDLALPVDAEALERQYLALSAMPSVRVVYSALGPVRSVQGSTGILLSRSTRDLALHQDAPEVLQKLKDVLLATGTETLVVRLNRAGALGRTLRLEQFIGDIPVLYGGVKIGVNDATGLVDGFSATFIPDRGLPRRPTLTEAEASKRVAAHLVARGIAKPGSVKTYTATLAYTGTHPDSQSVHLVWAVPVSYAPVRERSHDQIWIDAINGEIVGGDSLIRF